VAVLCLVFAPTAGADRRPATVGGRSPFEPVSPGANPTPFTAGGAHSTQSSINWAGYATSGATYSSVTGSWIQPAASCSGRSGLAAFWVGLDGYSASDPSVEQIGTDSDCAGRGRPDYYAWFEMYPSALVVLPPAYPVAPGDTLTATVAVDGSGYLLVLVDAGRWTYGTVQTPATPPQDASAEWIAEAPTSCHGASCTVVKLADFGAVGFAGAEANGAPVSSFAYDRIDMTTRNGKKIKASTSSLAPSGSGFTVSWLHS
jgi:hypothetical protein